VVPDRRVGIDARHDPAGLALSLAPMAYIARLTRVSMIDVLSSDFVRTAARRACRARRHLEALCAQRVPAGAQLSRSRGGGDADRVVRRRKVFSIPGWASTSSTASQPRPHADPRNGDGLFGVPARCSTCSWTSRTRSSIRASTHRERATNDRLATNLSPLRLGVGRSAARTRLRRLLRSGRVLRAGRLCSICCVRRHAP
jgi:hypothetical protein